MKFAGVDALIAPMSAAAKCTGKAGAPVLALPVVRTPAAHRLALHFTHRAEGTLIC